MTSAHLLNQLNGLNKALAQGDLVTDNLQVVQKHGFKWVLLKILKVLSTPFSYMFCQGDPWRHYRINHVAVAILKLCESNKQLIQEAHADAINGILSKLKAKGQGKAPCLEALNTCRTLVKTLVPSATIALPAVSAADLALTQRAVANFGHTLNEKISKDPKYADKSIAFSPLSIITVLGMALHAVLPQHKEKFIEDLGFKGMEEIRVHAVLAKMLRETVFEGQPNAHISIAQAVAISQKGDVSVASSFENVLQDVYQSEIFHSSNLKKDVNLWVDKKTNHKIPEIISDNLEEGIVLLNALGIELEWLNKFERPHQGWDRMYFTLGDDKKVPASMMSQTQDNLYPVYRGDIEGNGKAAFHMIEMPYRSPTGRNLSQVIFLPHDPKQLEALEKDWTHDAIKQCRSAAQATLDGYRSSPNHDILKVMITLPKTRTQTNLSLKDILSTMDLIPLLDPSKIRMRRPPVIGKVLHKSLVENDEEGTKAKVVTAMEMMCSCAPPSMKKPKVDFFHFNASHSFAYFIMDGDTVLVRGKVKSAEPLVLDNPNSNAPILSYK